MRRAVKFTVLGSITVLILALIVFINSHAGLSMVLSFVTTLVPGQLSVTASEGSLLGPVSLQGVKYHDKQVSVDIDRVNIDWQLSHLLAGTLAVNQLHVSDVSIRVLSADNTGQQKTEQLLLPFKIDLKKFRLDKLAIVAAPGAEPFVIEQVASQIEVQTDKIDIKSLVVQTVAGNLATTGTVSLEKNYPLQLSVNWNWRPPAMTELNGRGQLRGDLQKLSIQQSVEGWLEVNLQGEITGLADSIQWQSQLQVNKLALQDISPQLPAALLQGKLHGKGNLNNISLAGDLKAEQKQYGRTSAQFKLDTENRFNEYQFSLQGEYDGVTLPQAQYVLKGKGDLQQLTVSQLDIKALDGSAQGKAQFAWQPETAINADVQLRDINPAFIVAQWPGRLGAKLNLSTRPRKKGITYQLQVSELTGKLRSFPLQGAARGTWYNNNFTLDNLAVKIGSSDIRAKGSLDQAWNMVASLSSEHLDSLWPAARGRLDLQAKLAGPRTTPTLSLKGKGEKLFYAQEKIEQLAIELTASLAEQQPLNINLQASGVQTRGGQWQQASLQVQGTLAEHALQLQLADVDAAAHGVVRGQYHGKHWQGTFDQFDFNTRQSGQWQLQQAVKLSLSEKQIVVDRVCLQQTPAYLCAELNWNHVNNQAMLDGKALPLALFKPWLLEGIEVNGVVDLKASARQRAQAAMTAEVLIESTDKSVAVHFTEIQEHVTLAASKLSLLLDAKGLKASVDMPLSGGGGINTELQLPNWSFSRALARDQLLTAEIKIDEIPAEALVQFIPDLDKVQGHLHADLEINGTLGEPRLRGNVHWQQGRMLITKLGVTVSDISAELSSAQTNVVQFRLKARSGEGNLQITGQTRLAPDQGWPSEARLRSDNLEIMNIPEAYILVNSDLAVKMQGNTLAITGDIEVPRARLRPRDLPEGTASLSRDVVIVSSEQPVEKEAYWEVTSRVRVQLGERVDFNGFGVSGLLKGSLQLIDEPNKIPVGQGEVNISEGVYRMRGQNLSIRHGRLIFANSFIDDPGVDVEAIREIEDITVGVRLRGTLKQPQLAVFSEPAMAESDALSYLILGRALNQTTTAEGESMRDAATAMGLLGGDFLAQEIGGRIGLDELRLEAGQTTEQTALVIGKYISPKLYVRYLSGIVESSSIVQLRYQLSRRIQIQTESGYRGTQSVSGGDIFFTFEY